MKNIAGHSSLANAGPLLLLGRTLANGRMLWPSVGFVVWQPYVRYCLNNGWGKSIPNTSDPSVHLTCINIKIVSGQRPLRYFGAQGVGVLSKITQICYTLQRNIDLIAGRGASALEILLTMISVHLYLLIVNINCQPGNLHGIFPSSFLRLIRRTNSIGRKYR